MMISQSPSVAVVKAADDERLRLPILLTISSTAMTTNGMRSERLKTLSHLGKS